MDIKNKLREGLLLHESEIIMEGNIGDKIAELVRRLIAFLKKNPNKMVNVAADNLEYVYKVIANLRQSGRDYRAGLLDKDGPKFSEEARVASVDAVKDLGLLLSFVGMNTVLNTLVPFLGFAAGGVVMFFKEIAPEKIADFLTSSIEKARRAGGDKITEMLGILEDMGYYGVDDATQDEYTMGFKGH